MQNKWPKYNSKSDSDFNWIWMMMMAVWHMLTLCCALFSSCHPVYKSLTDSFHNFFSFDGYPGLVSRVVWTNSVDINYHGKNEPSLPFGRPETSAREKNIESWKLWKRRRGRRPTPATDGGQAGDNYRRIVGGGTLPASWYGEVCGCCMGDRRMQCCGRRSLVSVY